MYSSYEIFKMPKRILSARRSRHRAPSCVVRFPPFLPLRFDSGSSRMSAPRVTLSDKGAESAESCTFAYKF